MSLFLILFFFLQLWKQNREVNKTFTDISAYRNMNADKRCMQFKQGGSGDVESKDCSGSSALAVCGGKRHTKRQIEQYRDLFSALQVW